MKISTIELEKVLKDREEEVESVIKSFLDLKDNRYAANIYYSLEEILFLVLCAQLCGCESFREYEAYGKVKIDFLRRYLPYKYGTPSHSTIGRILAADCVENHGEGSDSSVLVAGAIENECVMTVGRVVVAG